MRWTTRAQLHLDRTASAWLIRGFVDPAAEFVFVGWDATPDPTDPRTFGMPGVLLSAHDEAGTCFAKILRTHDLEGDSALMGLRECVDAGVRHALGLLRTEPAEPSYQLGLALDSLGIGLSVRHEDDHQHLEAATPLYDALYTYLKLPDLTTLDLPPTQPERVAHLRSLVG